MTTQDLMTIIGALGFPIFLVLSVMLFIDKRLFPAIMKYLQDRSVEEMREREEQAAERKARHAEYMDNQRNNTVALNRLGDITESFVLSLESHDKNSARNYADIMARLEKIRGKDTGPLPQKQSGS